MTVRYGILGCGRMGTAHARTAGGLDGARVAAVCDADPEAARRLAAEVGATAHADLAGMLDAERLDALYVCTPARGRVEQVAAAAARGIALYIEKPLAASVEDGERIAEAVTRSGVPHTVGFQWRYLDVVDRARAIAGDDPIALVAARWYWTVPLVPWIRSRALGGGQMVDQLIHLVDLATVFAGPVARVFSAFTQQCTAGEMDNWDGYSTTARFERGAVGSFCSTYALHRDVGEAPALDVVQRHRLLRVTPRALEVREPGRQETIAPRDAVPGIARAFHAAVARGDASGLRAPVDEALHSLKVVFAATRSARRGEAVDVAGLRGFAISALDEA